MSDQFTVSKQDYIELLKLKRSKLDQEIRRLEEGRGALSDVNIEELETTPGGKVKRGAGKEAILQGVLNSPLGITRQLLADSLTIPSSSVYAHVSALKEEGLIKEEGGRLFKP